MAAELFPLHDRVLIRRVDLEKESPGSIVIPDTAKEKPWSGEVIAIGEGRFNKDGTRRPLNVRPGDQVLFGKFSGSEVMIDHEEFLIMREDEIFAVLIAAARAKGSDR